MRESLSVHWTKGIYLRGTTCLQYSIKNNVVRQENKTENPIVKRHHIVKLIGIKHSKNIFLIFIDGKKVFQDNKITQPHDIKLLGFLVFGILNYRVLILTL